MDNGKSLRKTLNRIFDFIDRYRNLFLLLLIAGIVLLMEGFIFLYTTLAIHQFSHLSVIFLFILFFTGSFLLFILFLYSRERGSGVEYMKEEGMAPYLRKINKYIPLSNRWISISIGILLILSVWVMLFLGIGNPGIGDSDIILILTGLMLIIYPFVPAKFSQERDFILTFFISLLIMMAIIPFIFDIFSKNFTYYFLTMPLHNILNSISIKNVLIPPSTIRITDVASRVKNDITIARSCSGIYSFSIFTSAFIAFVFTIYKKINTKSLIFLIAGIILSYIGNLLRMTIVVLAGYYYGRNALMQTHSSIGYIIFFIWMSVFWFILYRYLMREESASEE